MAQLLWARSIQKHVMVTLKRCTNVFLFLEWLLLPLLLSLLLLLLLPLLLL